MPAKRIVKTKDGIELTAKEELFCQNFAKNVETFGNGTQSYIIAYNVNLDRKNAYNMARYEASALLARPNVTARITSLLEEGGLNDLAVDKQLSFVIAQNADFSAKVKAIAEYNKLKARIVERQEIHGTLKVIPILGGDTAEIINVSKDDSLPENTPTA